MKLINTSKKSIIKYSGAILSILLISVFMAFYTFSQSNIANAQNKTEYNWTVHTNWQAEALSKDNPEDYKNWPDGKSENSFPKENELKYTFNQLQDNETINFTHLFLTTKANVGDKVNKTKHIRGGIVDGKTVTFKPTTLSINTSYTGFIQISTNYGNVFNSEEFTINTKDLAPGNIGVQGITNFRDMGGWMGSYNGQARPIKQGIIFRSSAMDVNGEQTITDEGITEMKDDLGFKTEIDLRDPEVDIPYNDKGILGKSVEYNNIKLNYSTHPLSNFINDEVIQDVLKQEFTLFADSTKYPIFYHCNIGTDRTGITAYLLNGLLGVAENDLYKDYMFSNFGYIRGSRSISTPQDYTKSLNKYYPDKTSLQERIETYLLEKCKISSEQIANIKANMLMDTQTNLEANITTKAQAGQQIPEGFQKWTLELFAGSDTNAMPLCTKDVNTKGETTSDTIIFDNINITHAGTFLYTIKQIKVDKWKPDIQTKPVYIKVDVKNGKFLVTGPYTDQTCEVKYDNNIVNFKDTYSDINDNVVKIHTEMQDAAVQNIDHNGIVIAEMSHNGCHGFVDRSKPLDYITSYNFLECGCNYISSAYLELVEGNGFYSPTPVTKTFNATISGTKATCTLNTLGIGKTYTYKFVGVTENGEKVCGPDTTIKTETEGPANKNVDTVTNVRDIGGWQTLDGHTIKQGLIYRTARIDAADTINESARNTLLNDFGLKTEIDLRATPTKSALGDDIEFHCIDTDDGGPGNFITNPKKCKATADEFTLIGDSSKLPLFFHCSIGTDRTGLVAMLLEGLLGMSEADIYKDYIFSNMGRIQYERTVNNITYDMKLLYDEYKKDSLQQNIIAYLTDSREGKPNLSMNLINNILNTMLEAQYSQGKIGLMLYPHSSATGNIPQGEQKFSFQLIDGKTHLALDNLDITTKGIEPAGPSYFNTRTFTEAGVYPFQLKELANPGYSSDIDGKTFYMKAEEQKTGDTYKLNVTGPYSNQECTCLCEGGNIPCNVIYNDNSPSHETTSDVIDDNDNLHLANTLDNNEYVFFVLFWIIACSGIYCLKNRNAVYKK